MKVRRGEKVSVEIRDYSFDFYGPVEITDEELDELRDTIVATETKEQQIKGRRIGGIGFRAEEL